MSKDFPSGNWTISDGIISSADGGGCMTILVLVVVAAVIAAFLAVTIGIPLLCIYLIYRLIKWMAKMHSESKVNSSQIAYSNHTQPYLPQPSIAYQPSAHFPVYAASPVPQAIGSVDVTDFRSVLRSNSDSIKEAQARLDSLRATSTHVGSARQLAASTASPLSDYEKEAYLCARLAEAGGDSAQIVATSVSSSDSWRTPVKKLAPWDQGPTPQAHISAQAQMVLRTPNGLEVAI